ncbi:MAG TPA: hypothetical protein PKV72_03585 [Candidatus Peribacteria bacterium]|nr:hypothetical protein [Candidatus Peribacteria bacterium]
MTPKLASSPATKTVIEPTAEQLREQYPHATLPQIEWLTRRFCGNTRKVMNMLALGATRPSVLLMPHQHVAQDRPQGGPSSVEAFFGEACEDNEQPAMTNGRPRRRSPAVESIRKRLGDRMALLGDTDRLFAFAVDPDMELSNNS